MSDMAFFYDDVDTPIGRIQLLADANALVHVDLPRSKHPFPVQPGWRRDPERLAKAKDQFAAWFAGERQDFDLALHPRGTPFQLAVWQALRTIGYAQTVSYGELARRIGRPRAVRAVGAANGANPLSIVVPCHRVIGSNGSLTGYDGGLEAKQWLHAHERRHARGMAA
jgi:methylated-DNA-[protein]-cysteine S-methyltransferase